METIYLVFAAAGTTVLIIQFLLTLIGLDLGHDVDAGHVEIGVGHAEPGGDVVDVSGDHDLDAHVEDHGHAHEASSSFFRMLSIRAVTAACAFFGLGGLAADSMELSALISLPVALVAGFIAMYIVAWIMRVLYGLRSEGNVYIECALGSHGTVYLAIPGEDAGIGKVLINVQDRTMEYDARSSHGPIATGTPVVVVDIVDSNTLKVEPVESTEEGDKLWTSC
jgi:membrane protein implicated in regulation of membrane protease activity